MSNVTLSPLTAPICVDSTLKIRYKQTPEIGDKQLRNIGEKTTLDSFEEELMMQRLQTCFFACLAFSSMLAVRPAGAQVLYGSVVGKVEDQTGAVVARTAVSLTNSATGQSRETTTDNEGRFGIGNVLPGSYELTVAAPGFRKYNQ